MIKKGYTAVSVRRDSLAWKDRQSLKNEVRLPFNSRAEVIRTSRDHWGRKVVRALIGGKVHTLSHLDWIFTPIRVGELRRWRDDRDSPFVIIDLSWHDCRCMSPDGNFNVSHRYAEENSEVISAAG